ncbi:phage virion morphogenesis protein [Uruburuella testudinis]|uniref:Phage virion morphogenesis protein n=1 Tax=Uruburuella testudinis TaxID=1282863 RepID=A0ABY4DX13_9NEIS|nr:phage virion morphogenesis protein [Uruburuella testudinis]UOO83204.1 phage virion morphogenesis protein [Uruburuella testudinis]
MGSNKPYAAIHHLGGQTAPHEIRPRNKKVLAFYTQNGDSAYSRSVQHPGSKTPERPYLPINGSGRLQPGAEKWLLDIALKSLKKGL